MRTLANAIAAGALFLSVVTPIYAEITPTISRDIQAAAGANSSIRVKIDGDTVMLHGYVEDENSLRKMEQAAKRNGAVTVIMSVLKTN